MTITKTQLRKAISNANVTIANSRNVADVQRATLLRESAYTAVKLLQSGQDAAAVALCLSAGIALGLPVVRDVALGTSLSLLSLANVVALCKGCR
jgi:isopentenyl diphosphate isomerase/L-lactate dehydrogenase-like FMN-dependent dehydrogenase